MHIDSLHIMESLRGMRSPEIFHKLFECISTVAKLDVTLVKRRTAVRSAYVYRAAAAAGGTDISVEDYFRINVYYQTLDNNVRDIERKINWTN